MSAPLVLGIDVGTGSAKGVLADAGGHIIASASAQYSYQSPAPGAAEQDPEDWWRAVCHVCQQLLSSTSATRERLRGVAISGQGVAAVVLDRAYQPVRPAMLWMDTRAAEQAAQMAAAYGDQIARVSGKSCAAYAAEPKLLWLRQNEPEHWKRVAHVMTTTGYINLRLVGRPVMNRSDAGVLLTYDLHRQSWSDENRAAMDLEPGLFPELADSHAVIGSVSELASTQCGLPVGLPVVAGGEDTSSAGLAMGVVREGDVQLSAGTACTVYLPASRFVPDERLLTFPHVLPQLVLTGGSIVSGGVTIDWLLSLLNGSKPTADQQPSLAQKTEEAACLSPGAGGLVMLPYFAGELQPINDGFARGVLFGLSLQTSAAHLLRSIMEGTAFAVRHNLDVAHEVGIVGRQVFAVGGPTRNALWCQIMADVTGLPLRVMDKNAGAAFGDAILAAWGTGLIGDPLQMQNTSATFREYEPHTGSAAAYAELYAIYRELYPRLRDLFPRLRPLGGH